MPRPIVSKMTSFTLITGAYFNLLLIVFVSQVNSSPVYLTCLIMYYGAGFIDTITRPLPEHTILDRYARTLPAYFLSGPILPILAFHENLPPFATLVPAWNNL